MTDVAIGPPAEIVPNSPEPDAVAELENAAPDAAPQEDAVPAEGPDQASPEPVTPAAVHEFAYPVGSTSQLVLDHMSAGLQTVLTLVRQSIDPHRRAVEHRQRRRRISRKVSAINRLRL